MIANLGLWFTLSLIFGPLDASGPIPVPVLPNFSGFTFCLVTLAVFLLVAARVPLLGVLALCAAAGTLGLLI